MFKLNLFFGLKKFEYQKNLCAFKNIRAMNWQNNKFLKEVRIGPVREVRGPSEFFFSVKRSEVRSGPWTTVLMLD